MYKPENSHTVKSAVTVSLNGVEQFSTWTRLYGNGKRYLTNGWVFSKTTSRKLPYTATNEGWTLERNTAGSQNN